MLADWLLPAGQTLLVSLVQTEKNKTNEITHCANSKNLIGIITPITPPNTPL